MKYRSKQNKMILAASGLALCSVLWGEDPACCKSPPPPPPQMSCCKTSMDKAESHTSNSLFNVESLWETEKGEVVPLSRLGTRLHLVAMVYTSCQYACPRIISDLKVIESGIGIEDTSRYGICLVTIDPKRDTVAVYNDYAVKRGLEKERWSFLRGKSGDILELANLLGVRYKELPDGDFSHSNIITLLDSDGEIVYQLNGLEADPSELIEKAKELLDPA